MVPDVSADERRALAALASRPSAARVSQDLTPYARLPRNALSPLGSTPLVVMRHGRPFGGADAVLETGWTPAQMRLAALSSDSSVVLATRDRHTIAEDDPALVAEVVHGMVSRLRAGSDPSVTGAG